VLQVLSFVLLATTVNLLAASLALAGFVWYTLIYTMWLKRRTPQNIVIGGAAGAVPPLVGWAAATGEITLQALLLFAIVLVWTPSHFWSLAVLIRPAYEAAGVPMLPVVRGERATARQILVYSIALFAVTIAPVAWGGFGLLYLAVALPLGAGYLELARRLFVATTARNAARLFHYSLLYLALLFAAIAADSVT
jgi:protoheme IX farnesyltransferase